MQRPITETAGVHKCLQMLMLHKHVAEKQNKKHLGTIEKMLMFVSRL